MAVRNAVHVSASSVVRLAIRIPASINLEHARQALAGPQATWLGERLPDDGGAGPGGAGRRYACDLELGVGTGRRLAFRKSAIISLGAPEPLAEGWLVPIEWRAASLAPLFPVFVGQLEVRAASLGLAGYYAPPFGDLGAVLDRAALGVGARRVARWLLEQVAEACT